MTSALCMNGAVLRTLASHHCGLGSIPKPSVTFGLSSLLVLVPALWVFSRFSDFPPSTKTNTANSNMIWKTLLLSVTLTK